MEADILLKTTRSHKTYAWIIIQQVNNIEMHPETSIKTVKYYEIGRNEHYKPASCFELLHFVIFEQNKR